ncbi:MAG: helix-turn-helix domain-containing protein [Thiobacillus sp.]|nr:helix-turn-helix domain-containing protein [Thiobacillus sp.]
MEIVFVPFLSRDRFCQLVGITPDVLERWIRDGRVKTFRIGKRSLVDMRQWLNSQSVGAQ